MGTKKEKELGGGLKTLFAATTAPTAGEAPAGGRADIIGTIQDDELREALRRRQASRRGRPRKDEEQARLESELYTRATFIVSRVLYDKLKEISYRETLTLKEIIEAIFANAIDEYEAGHGEIVPQEHTRNAKEIFRKQ